MRLLIVESPNKVKTIKKYLGGDFEVRATSGHIRDLPADELGVDLATFEPAYVVIDAKKRAVAELRAAVARASEVLLATDADREGEAISWHVMKVLRVTNARRVRFTEITAKALKAAVDRRGPLDQNLTDAQQARRVLDRLVGFQVSPLLRRFGTNHSAGRVQSATLHLVVMREQAREAFKPRPYWVLEAKYANGLVAKYAKRDSKGELAEAQLSSQPEADAILAQARGPHVVRGIETRPVERKPKPPFTTSTLQQAASVQLRMKPDRTMSVAQALFEKGAITYHRTDSVSLSEDAISMAREFIARDYPEALPPTAPVYRGKADAQEAHEAIRPTSLNDAPEELTSEELALYELIRARFIACQCKPALLAQTTVSIESGSTNWRARGSVVQFPSFLKYLPEDEDAEAKRDEEAEQKLPRVGLNEVLVVSSLDSTRRETKPPPRFTQASLIKEMERVGIGRPATFAQTVKVLFTREYLAEEKRFVLPTPRGRLIDGVVAAAFAGLVLAEYTAQMEERLDEVAAGKRRWKDEVRTWYSGFAAQLAQAPSVIEAHAKSHPADVCSAVPSSIERKCPRCQSPLLRRSGNRGEFVACSAYPKCSYSADPSARDSQRACPSCSGKADEVTGKFGPYLRCVAETCGHRVDLSPTTDEKCPLCSGPMRARGTFLGCARYPECKGSLDVKALAKARKAGRNCPDCGGLLVERRGKNGTFLGCSRYPSCRYTDSGKPNAEVKR